MEPPKSFLGTAAEAINDAVGTIAAAFGDDDVSKLFEPHIDKNYADFLRNS